MTESQIQDEVRLVLGAAGDGCWWRNNVGTAETRGHHIRYGVGNPGGADLIGIFRGRFVAIEIKTAIGRQTAEQKMFQHLVERKGGIYVVMRSADDARAWLESMKEHV